MDTQTLLLTLIPLYIMVVAGYVAGQLCDVDNGMMAKLVIFIIVPIVFVLSVATLPWDPKWLWLPVLAFIFSALMAVLMYAVSKLFYAHDDRRPNLIAMASGSANTGYFGLPVFLAIYGETYIGAYMLAIIGVSVAEATTNYYLLSRGQGTFRDSMKRVAKLPAVYACALGILANVAGIGALDITQDILEPFKGAYIVCGMMIVGVGLAKSSTFAWDIKLNILLFGQKFILWPLVGILMATGAVYAGLLPQIAVSIMTILTITPLAANSVAFATYTNTHPEKIALTVLLSTLFAAVYIPMVLAWL